MIKVILYRTYKEWHFGYYYIPVDNIPQVVKFLKRYDQEMVVHKRYTLPLDYLNEVIDTNAVSRSKKKLNEIEGDGMLYWDGTNCV